MTEKQTLLWIHTNLVPLMREAMKQSPQIAYPTDLLSAMTMRETGNLVQRYVQKGLKAHEMHPLMRGDYSQRRGEKEKSYHGYGYMQIDIASFPEFVKSGAWKDPIKTYIKAMSVLEGKRTYLKSKFPHLEGRDLLWASVAAYNCGEGNVRKVLNGIVKNKKGEVVTDVDWYTHGKDYSKEVARFMELYNSIPETHTTP
jgi:hypothetical protein